ncbi:hypothetical protein D3C81_1684900 [compost metagenome]
MKETGNLIVLFDFRTMRQDERFILTPDSDRRSMLIQIIKVYIHLRFTLLKNIGFTSL